MIEEINSSIHDILEARQENIIPDNEDKICADTLKVKGYAKINLTLDIAGKREDGYHSIESVMQSIMLYDEITLSRASDHKIHLLSDKKYLPNDEKNTAYRAAVQFFTYTGIQAGIGIHIRKSIPSRAGLGGGSADAAAVLAGMNALFKTALSEEQLMTIGAKIGADVPFCIAGGTGVCTGIGELVEKVAPMPDCILVICKPPVGMSTPRAYSLIDQYPMTTKRSTPSMLHALAAGNIKSVGKSLGNRFDEVMRIRQVREIRRRMQGLGAIGAMMSGSGSAVYGIFTAMTAAERCMKGISELGEVFLTYPRHEGAMAAAEGV